MKQKVFASLTVEQQMNNFPLTLCNDPFLGECYRKGMFWLNLPLKDGLIVIEIGNENNNICFLPVATLDKVPTGLTW